MVIYLPSEQLLVITYYVEEDDKVTYLVTLRLPHFHISLFTRNQ